MKELIKEWLGIDRLDNLSIENDLLSAKNRLENMRSDFNDYIENRLKDAQRAEESLGPRIRKECMNQLKDIFKDHWWGTSAGACNSNIAKAVLKEAVKERVEMAIHQEINQEEFIDEIINRIKRKQLD